jgi:hypothetical protein
MGLKKAAVARLCLNGDIYRAMPEVCVQYLPLPGGDISDIWLVKGGTGKSRLCNHYDVTQQRCRVWAHVAHHSAQKNKATASGWRAEGFPAIERCTKTDDEPGLLQKTSMLCGKFFPPIVPIEIRPDVRTVLIAHPADEAVLKIGQPRFVGITILDQAANSLTQSIVGCWRFLILIQCFDRPA